MDMGLVELLADWGGVGQLPPDFWGDQDEQDALCLDGTIWAPRKKQSDAKDYVDHNACLRAAFQADWMATSGANPSNGRSFGSKAFTPEALTAVKAVLETWYPMLFRIFCYFSHVGADVSDNVNGMSHAGYVQMLLESRLGVDPLDKSGAMYARHARTLGEDGWELIWISVNSSGLSKSQSSHNSDDRLTRAELLEVLVRAATDSKPVDAMARCVHEICEDLLEVLSKAPNAGLIYHNTTVWRNATIYLPETCAILAHHSESLHSLFKIYAGDVVQSAKAGSSKLLGADEWISLLRDVGIVKEIGFRRSYLIFVHSRMAVIDESTRKGQDTNTQLPFEGFAEAIVRVAEIKALPSDREMRRTGYQVPGEFLGAMLGQGGAIFNEWLRKAQLMRQQNRVDPIWRRVDMLILLLVSIVQFGVEKLPGGASLLLRGSPDERLSYEEVKRFFKHPTPNVFETSTGAA